METFKPLICLNIKGVGVGLFQFVDKDELFTKEEYELEISKMRKMLVKELEDDIITERAKIINNAVKEIEKTLSILGDDGMKKGIDIETAKKEIRSSLTNISNSLFVDPEDTTSI